MNNALDIFIYGVLPYLAMAIFFVETIRRYFTQSYSYTSLSSQFLENRFHFWTLVPFHYGIIGTLLGHVIAFMFPRQLLLWNSVPIRLFILEVTALTFGLLLWVGIVHIIVRRLKYSKVRCVTSPMDWVLYGALFLMVNSGLLMAIFHQWGTSWFAASVSPYLWSLVKFHPQIHYVENLPILFKFHFVLAFLIILIFPFTRLVHVLVIPNHYFLRKRQVVRWYWDRKAIRKPDASLETKL